MRDTPLHLPVPKDLAEALATDAKLEAAIVIRRPESRGGGDLSDADRASATACVDRYFATGPLAGVSTRVDLDRGDTVSYANRDRVETGQVVAASDDLAITVIASGRHDVIARDARGWRLVQSVTEEEGGFDEANRVASRHYQGRQRGNDDRRARAAVEAEALVDIAKTLWGPKGDDGEPVRSELLAADDPYEDPEPGSPAWKLNAIAVHLRRIGVVGPFEN